MPEAFYPQMPELSPLCRLGVHLAFSRLRFTATAAGQGTTSPTRSNPMSARATWKPHTKHGELTERSDLPNSVFAFPKERKMPMTDASHVRNALARFDQVEDVTDAERDTAFA